MKLVLFKKHFVCLLTFGGILLCWTAKAQTWIGPQLGIGFMNISDSGEYYPLPEIVSVKGVESRDFLVGLSLIQGFTDKFSAELGITYSRQLVGISEGGIVGYTHLKFSRYNYSLCPRYRIFEKVYIGLGFSIDQFRKFKIGKDNIDIWSPENEQSNQDLKGWLVSLDYQIGQILIGLRYLESYASSADKSKYVNRINSFELMLNYQFKIANKWERNTREPKCPRL